MPKCVSSATGASRTAGLYLVGLLALTWASQGCVQHPDHRFFYLRGTTAKPLLKAQSADNFRLYPRDSIVPKFSIDLAAGDEYGFRRREDDSVVAVARDKEIELGDRYSPSYYWVPKKDDKNQKQE